MQEKEDFQNHFQRVEKRVMVTVRDNEKKTFCQICNVQCGMIAHLEEGKVVKVEGDPHDPGCRGQLCIKGKHSIDILYARDRLRYPMLRKDGDRRKEWRRASWGEAMEFIASRLEKVRKSYGPQSLAFYMGSTNMVVDTMLINRFSRCFGSANIHGSWNVCIGPKVIGYESTFGRPKGPWCDLRRARFILLWGTNPTVSHIHRYHGVTEDIQAAQNDGATLVVIDPRRIPLAQKAEYYLQIRPDTDLALALAMIKIIIDEELYDHGFVSRYTYGFDQLAQHVKPCSAEWAAAITDIPAETIVQVTREFASTKPASLERREGVQHSINATQTLRAMAILLTLTGNVDVPGGLSFVSSLVLRDIPLPGDIVEPQPASWLEKFPLAASCASRIPDDILADKPDPVRALIVLKGNPISCFANTSKTINALNKLDLLVVHDLFPTETTEIADVMLPGCTFFEKGDISPKSLRSDRLPNFALPVIEPLHETVPGWKFICMLAQQLGYGSAFEYNTEQEVFDAILHASNLTLEQIAERKPVDPLFGKLLEKGFTTSTGKIELYSTLLEKYGHEPLPTINPSTPWLNSDPESEKEYPYPLTTGFRQNAFNHSCHRNIAALFREHPNPVAQIGCKVAEEMNVCDGDKVEIRTENGRAVFDAVVSKDIHPGIVGLSHGWQGEQNANCLTDDLLCDPVVGTPAYRGLYCSVHKYDGKIVTTK